MSDRRLVFEDDFDEPTLNPAVWLPHYLPHWSSRAASAAQYEIKDSCLHLFIPPDQGLWCEDDHKPSLRVSGIQSGNSSGPVGSTIGQHRYREGLVIKEEQEPFWGFTPAGGHLELRARGVVSPRSMVALWMVGLEDVPERSAEICVNEMFGKSVAPGESVEIGMGLRGFRDPSVPDDFAAPRVPIDISEFHLYAVEWSRERADFFVDGTLIRSYPNAPGYPMQLMIATFDFPEEAQPGDENEVPEFVIDYIRYSEVG